MALSWKLGKVAGIDLHLHWTFLLWLAFVGLATPGGLTAVAVLASVFACVALHEFGHAIAARKFGIATRDITLYPIGGVARLEGLPRAPIAELTIALAGPAVNLAIALGLTLIAPALDGAAGAFVGLLAWVNWMLAAFNLIPAFPMDGGRVLRALLSPALGRSRATDLAANVGQVLAVAFGAYCLWHGLWMQAALAAFLYFAAARERESTRIEEAGRARPDFAPAPGAPIGLWVRRGDGVWQLMPIVVNDGPSRQARPWA